jgi:hypothetical protein
LGQLSGAVVTPGSNANDNVYMTLNPLIGRPNSPTSLLMVARWSVYLPATVSNQRFFSGLIRGIDGEVFQSHTALALDYIVIYKISSLANWQIACRAAGTETSLDTGVVATADAVHSMRVESAGSAAQYGANIVRFVINGIVVGTMTTNIPGIELRFQFGSLMSGAATGQPFSCSQLDISHNPAGAAARAL